MQKIVYNSAKLPVPRLIFIVNTIEQLLNFLSVLHNLSVMALHVAA